jgi:hypothetical protein
MLIKDAGKVQDFWFWYPLLASGYCDFVQRKGYWIT